MQLLDGSLSQPGIYNESKRLKSQTPIVVFYLAILNIQSWYVFYFAGINFEERPLIAGNNKNWIITRKLEHVWDLNLVRSVLGLTIFF